MSTRSLAGRLSLLDRRVSTGRPRRRLRVGEERKIETLESFFKWFGTKRTGRALHVLDRFHVAGKLGG